LIKDCLMHSSSSNRSGKIGSPATKKNKPKPRPLGIERLEAREVFARTTGLEINTGEAFPGYTLFAPSTTTTTYLIDNNGQRVHSWQSNWEPMTAQLMPDGDLVRAGRLPPNPRMSAAGEAGILERFNWEGQRTWYYKLDNARYRSHHAAETSSRGEASRWRAALPSSLRRAEWVQRWRCASGRRGVWVASGSQSSRGVGCKGGAGRVLQCRGEAVIAVLKVGTILFVGPLWAMASVGSSEGA